MHAPSSGKLRGRLRELSPELHTSLERSWEIAFDTWLYAIGMNSGSTNSYPHLRNVERYLDEIVTEFERLPSTRFTEPLTAPELYLLLASVLFHDIGRIWDGQRLNDDMPDIPSYLAEQRNEPLKHAQWSGWIVNRYYAELGIPSLELAKALAKICLFHDPPSGMRQSMLNGKLVRTVIDPFGEIREPFVAALLTLADTMDGTYTRILPLYLAKPSGIGIVALFRQLVRGVRVDAAAGMIRTVLTPDCETTVLQGSFTLTIGNSAVDALGADCAEKVKRILEVGVQPISRDLMPPPDSSGKPSAYHEIRTVQQLMHALEGQFPRSEYKTFLDEGCVKGPTDDATQVFCWLVAHDVIRIVRTDSSQIIRTEQAASCVRFEQLPRTHTKGDCVGKRA